MFDGCAVPYGVWGHYECDWNVVALTLTQVDFMLIRI
jgi:hypothetical protein